MKYIYNNYIDFCNTAILQSQGIVDADLSLSFSLRKEKNNEVVAFISLKREGFPNCENKRGCRIINLFVQRIESKANYSVINTSLLDKLYQEALSRIMIWCDDGVLSFDYIWFDTSDFEESFDVVDYLQDNFIRQNNLIFIPIDRNHPTS